MRKLSLLLLAAASVSTSSFAQTPGQVNRGLVTKISATWCGPCGGWGWVLTDEIKAATHDKAMYMGIFPTNSNPGWGNPEFVNNTANAFQNVSTFMGTGYPSHGANALDKSKQNSSGGGINTAGVKSDVIAAINDFANAPVVASTGFTVEKKGNDIIVKSKTQFWQAANGEYYLAAYMVEDGALNRQANKTSTSDPNDKIPHSNVLRGSMSGTTTADAWGVQIANGAITANQTYDKEFKFTVTDSKWDMAKMKVEMILWKKEGSAFKYVNGNDIYQFVASVDDVSAVGNLNLYPNPATDRVDVNFGTAAATDVTINMTDAMGRLVYTSGSINVTAGETVHTIYTNGMAAGTYNVSVVSDNGVSTKRVAVVK